MKKIKYNYKKKKIKPIHLFPSLFTYANALCGFYSIVFSIKGDFYNAGILIIIAILMDGFDGRSARFFEISNEFGKELDSLADLVSFGVAPAILVYLSKLYLFGTTGMLIAFLLIFGGISRLARFNVINTSSYFLGLPIPVSAMLVSFIFIADINFSKYIFSYIVIILCILMISNIKYPSFKQLKIKKQKQIIVIFALFLIVFFANVFFDIKKLLILPPVFYILFGPFLETQKYKKYAKSN